MKKIVLFAIAAGVSLAASAQTFEDALLFSQSEYWGTARGVGMGNALTAIGADPGSLVFNPAGSAVATYSQFFVSPGLSISSVMAQGTSLPGEEPIGLGDAVKTGYVRVKLPAMGFILNMDTGRRTGFKRMSFGFMAHVTADYTSRFNASGVNADNSYAASVASSAMGYSPEDLGLSDWYAKSAPAWTDMTAYRSNMFNSLSGHPGNYVALTEVVDGNGNIRLAAPVQQGYGEQTTGSKADLLFNFGVNYSDCLYLGANLGITSINYRLSEYWKESPQNPAEFPSIYYDDGTQARFESLRMKYNYRLTGGGVYFKAGVLWRPVAGLRLGAAIQTPTLLTLSERYGFSGEVSLSGMKSSSAESPEDEWSYAYVNPFRFNVGAAYAIGNYVVASADYEMVNYGSCRFRNRTGDGFGTEDSFRYVNEDIRDFLGISHLLRAGLEVKPTPALSLRAGYNFTTAAEHAYWDGNAVVKYSADQLASMAHHAFSAGIGYSFGSFYMDAAARFRMLPAEYVTPYCYYYAPDETQYWNKVEDENFLTPEVGIRRRMTDVILTLGWRF